MTSEIPPGTDLADTSGGTYGRRYERQTGIPPVPEGDPQQMSDAKPTRTKKEPSDFDLAAQLEPHEDNKTDLDQKIAAAEAKLDRLRDKSRALETGQKVILGGLLLARAREDAQIRAWLLAEAQTHITREADAKRIKPLLAKLAKLPKPEVQSAARQLPPLPPLPKTATLMTSGSATAPTVAPLSRVTSYDREPLSESRPLPRPPTSD